MARKQYPSDHRRYFRVDSPDLADKTAHLSDAEFRAFMLILAIANETRAQERSDTVTIARNRLASVAPNRRDSGSTSARVVRELCAKQSWELHENGATWTIHVRNWSKKQGFTPAELRRDSDETPAPTPTPTPTPKNPPIRPPLRAPESTAAAPPKRGPTDPPERLTDEQRGALDTWCAAKHPSKLPRIRDLEEACLDYFRSRGKRHRDWLATVRTWVRNERASPDPRKQDPDEIDRQAVEMIRARREQREQRRSHGSSPPADVRRLQPALPARAAGDVRGGARDA